MIKFSVRYFVSPKIVEPTLLILSILLSVKLKDILLEDTVYTSEPNHLPYILETNLFLKASYSQEL